MVVDNFPRLEVSPSHATHDHKNPGLFTEPFPLASIYLRRPSPHASVYTAEPISHSHLSHLQFGSAIFIGLAFGLGLVLTTSTTFTLLGLYDAPKAPYVPSRNTSQLSVAHTRPDTPDEEQKQLDALLAGISSSPESDHLIATLQGAGWRDPANTKRKRRSMGRGLAASGRFGTILEEDDDSP